MKNRLIITVSDVNSTKSYNIHQLVRKLAFFIIIAALTIIGGAFYFINFLLFFKKSIFLCSSVIRLDSLFESNFVSNLVTFSYEKVSSDLGSGFSIQW